MPVETRSGIVGVEIFTGTSDSFVTEKGTSSIAVIGTAPDMTGDFELNTAKIVDEFNLANLGEAGSLPAAVEAIRSQRGPNGTGIVLVVPVEEGVDEAATLSNVTGTEAAGTGVYALLDAQSLTGVRPGIVIAPEWTHQMPGGAKNSVVTAMEAIVPQFMAHAMIDCPDGPSQGALDYADTNNNHWLAQWWPWLKVSTANGEEVRPPSGYIAGRLSARERERGIHFSMLNTPLFGISGLTQPVSYNSADATATLLGNRAVNVIVRGNSGFLSYGDETTATSQEKQLFSLAVSRTGAFLKLSIKAYLHDEFLGRPMNAAFWTAAEQGVGRFLDPLVATGVINAYRFVTDTARQTPEATAARIANFIFEWVPAPPARYIRVEERLKTRIEEIRVQI